MTDEKTSSRWRLRRASGGTEQWSAVLLLLFTVLAIAWANTPFGATYEAFWHTEVSLAVGGTELAMSLEHVVSDGLMALFFFAVGLEVKRELAIGELTERSRAVVPVAAAVAGLLVPAAVFWAFTAGSDVAGAWGIVISTDTAFLIGALIIIGPRHPARLRVFLLTLAVVDDIGALAVIAFFYTEDLRVAPLLASFVLLGLAALVRFLPAGARGPLYALLGVGVWFGFYTAGVHATLAGVAIALLIPVASPHRKAVERGVELTRAFRQSPNPRYAARAARGLRQSISINERMQAAFGPWIAFAVLPVFALANAGVRLDGETLSTALTSRLTWGVITGLVVGKLVGITAVTALVDRTGLGRLAPGLGLGRIAGGAALSGIGFTISLLIISIAIDDPGQQDEARVGVLAASVLAFGLGWALLRAVDRIRPPEPVGHTLNRPFDPERDHFLGRADAPLVLVEYADFECPFCSRATGTVDEVRAHFGEELVWVWRHFPLTSVHPHAELAARAGEAAARQDRMFEYGTTLFENQDHLEREDLLAYAEQIGLDLERFEEDLDAAKIQRRVSDDADDVDAMDLSGTPTFFVNGTRHDGPFDTRSLISALQTSRTGNR